MFGLPALPPPPASNEVVLSVDAREAARGLFHVSERVPVQGGTLSLSYPKWIPGEHAPTGPINSVIRFEVRAGGKALAWRRDPVDLFRIDVPLPRDAHEVEVAFDETDGGGDSGDQSTPHLARIKWNRLVWYPRGKSDDVTVRPDITLPEGWSIATALEPDRQEGAHHAYRPVNLTRLVDSPAQIGRYAQTFDVTGKSPVRHTLDVTAENSAAIRPEPETLASMAHIHEEMEAVTGTRHYNHYDWLLTLSDEGGSEGLEHHESSEDGEPEKTLTDPLVRFDLGDLMCHEYFHSYNGKFRRPKGLATPEFETPMQDDLLWVYEGLTQFYGEVLAARAGFWTPEQYRERLAQTVDGLRSTKGREWRPLDDTAVAASLLYSDRGAWSLARRGVDYYAEMTLVWLEADGIIRDHTDGKKGMDDFLRAFHGGPANGPELKPYTYEEVLKTLNGICAYDWNGFFQTRVYGIQPEPTVAGIEAAGWRVVYNDTPNAANDSRDAIAKGQSYPSALGLKIADGAINDLVPGSPADKAGLVPGTKILVVNGKPFSDEVLLNAIRAKEPLELTGQYKNTVRLYRIDYTGGLLFPHLEPIPGKPDRLTPLCQPRREP